MEDKQIHPTGQPDKEATPTQEPAQQKGSNDPDFASEDSGVKKDPENIDSRELPADTKISQSTTELQDIEKRIDPGNEHCHSEL